ncbi:site-specific integrase [Paracandidimonas soli]|uniref:Phage integrase family protein n=1 Tax=Paracandidimonas soli TaxID=1917182 RepID=A0A4R3UT69_9BURK|nr:site-specific integrase [Paracandidimonas soli]TCU93917.1 phage integrase family protein [Paracandidimonas soli]
MPIRKDKKTGVYHVDFYTPSGERVRGSARTKDKVQAQEYHDRLRAQYWRQGMLGDKPNYIFEEAAVRFLKLCAGQRDYATKQLHVAYWRSLFAGRELCSLTANEILDGLPTHRVIKGKPCNTLANGTKNKYIATIRRLLNLCVEWEWLDRAPKLPRFDEPVARIRWEPPHRIMAMVDAITVPWMRDAVIVAVMTGMRETEQFSLAPGQVMLAQRHTWVTHDTAKSKRGRAVPLNDDAYAVFERRLKRPAKWVFTRDNGDGRRIGQHDRRVFARACEAVGITDFHWHDLRHTWASWHVQGIMTGTSTPLMVLKDLGGWETIEMVQKYAHLAPSHIAAHAGTVNFWSIPESEKETPPDKEALVA